MISIQKLFDVVAAHAEWLILGSLLMFAVGIVLVPAMIVRIPADYFVHERRHTLSRFARRPLLRLVLVAGKNVLGAVLLVAGVALLFLPGQGLLTLLAGLMIMNYPGKFAFERWLVRRGRVLPAINWLRARYGREPLHLP